MTLRDPQPKTNIELANLFLSMGALLKTQGANVHRIRAYYRAAETIASLKEDITNLSKRGDLPTLPGVGKDLSAKIQEYLATGTIQAYESLKTPLPSVIQPWVNFPGFSEPLVQDLYFRLKIHTLDDLEHLVRSQLLRTRPGMENSTEALLEAIQQLREQQVTITE